MRSDTELGIDPGNSISNPFAAELIPGVSHSGHERNRLFLNRAGEQFVDVSGVSGLDDAADGRSFALLDFDRDGWLDIAVVNANAPLLRLYRNGFRQSKEAAAG